MLIVAIIFFVVAGIIAIVRVFANKKMGALAGAERKSIGDVVSLAKETKAELAELGDENLIDERGVFVGNVSCDEPLISPLANQPCIYYSMEITYKSVEQYQERDSNGNMQTRSRSVTKTLESSSNSTRFTLSDDSGSVLVDPRDGIFEGTTVSYNKTEPYVSHSQGSASLKIGGFSLNLGGGVFGNALPQTLTSKEEIIGLDRKLTVVGSVQDKMGELVLEGKPKDKIRISTLSMQEMLDNAKKGLRNQAIAMGVCAALGLVFLVLHFVL